MREFLSVTLVVLIFLVLLHTVKGDFYTEEDDLFYKMLYRRATQKKGVQKKPVTVNAKTKNKPSPKKNTAITIPKTSAKTTTTTKKASPTNGMCVTVKTTEPYNYTAWYSKLENYQVGAKRVSEKTYPWVARVIHSRNRDTPYICTAICKEKAIFITAARCILSLKVMITTVKYQGHKLPAIAFVTPSIPTNQYYEDIGIIVVNDKKFKGEWKPIEIDEKFMAQRKDKEFQWFNDLKLTDNHGTFRVVGYAAEKFYHKFRTPDLPHYELCALNVTVSLKMCERLLSKGSKVKGYNVPCYLQSTLSEFLKFCGAKTNDKRNYTQCRLHHGVEGGAIININTNKLVGVATWAVYDHNPDAKKLKELPVGFAIPNSKNYFSDYECAKKIRDNQTKKKGKYQKLCN